MENNKIIIYTADTGQTKIDVKLENEVLWVTQAQICELHRTSKANVSEHIKHFFDEELKEKAAVWNFRTIASDGKTNMTSFYNFD